MDSNNWRTLQRIKAQQDNKTSLFWIGHWWFFTKPQDMGGKELENQGLHNKRWILLNDFDPDRIDDQPLMKVRTTSDKALRGQDYNKILAHAPHPEDCSCYDVFHEINENGYVLSPNKSGVRNPRPLPVYKRLLNERPICEEPDVENNPHLGKDFLKKLREMDG
jgi:hypothetical protein